MSPSPSSPPTVSPYLVVEDVDVLIDFTTTCFSAEEIDRNRRTDGSVAAASIRIGASVIMMTEGPSDTDTARMHVYVEDVDAVYQRALKAGATSLSPPQEAPDGGRRAGVQDPSGNQWWLSTASHSSAAA